ncbi:acyl-CoA dehydrogenase [Amycolatopsis acidicola]|uniref:Acyl-CoA dehydrogenase n=1 Tax=Amycolatopsis acidicola TaxID=2596893 RepID=A0A5N0VIB6_9PSEU|nr:acyl-CoA dehydrogenase family protein [Amycolatopsis acidicola]KAA9164451.1 acyl-CoA dehydrogenase [Amycolatopsis acidicola]
MTWDEGLTWAPELTDEEQRWQLVAEELAGGPFALRAAEIDATGNYPWDNVGLLTESGLTGLLLPAEYGGEGAPLSAGCAVAETIARVCASTCTIWSSYAIGSLPLLYAGSEAQKRRYLPEVAAGKAIGFGLTERHTGSDPSNVRTSAEKTADGWSLEGEKWLVGNGGSAHYYTAFARDGGKLTAFLLERDGDRLVIDDYQDKMGLRGTTTSNLKIDCEVPADRQVGERGRGLALALQTLNTGRVLAAALSCGIAEAAFAAASRRAVTREAFGGPIIGHQGISFCLADVATELSAARMMTWQAARGAGPGGPDRQLSSMAKLYASEVAHRAVDAALQVFGAEGYAKPHPVERAYRDQRILEIFEGSSEIQRVSLGRGIAAFYA